MQLFGSTASPFVRRLRLALAHQEYEFIALNIFEGAGREQLVQQNPARKVPVLVDGEQHIFDSNVIYRYLASKFQFKALSWAEENSVTIINAVNDSLVELLLCQRSGFDTDENKLFFNLQHERVEACLTALDEQVKQGGFGVWDYPSMCLYSLLDWLQYRQLADLKPYSALVHFVQEHQGQAAVAETDPRLG